MEGEEVMGNIGEKAGKDGKRGGSPGREVRKKGMKEQQEEKESAHTDEINLCCREAPFSIHMAL